MKFLYVGDIHERKNPPKSRIDDWQSTLQMKADEIWNYANKYDVSAILQGGDFLDKPMIDDEYLITVINRWSTIDTSDLLRRIAMKEIDEKEVLDTLQKGKPILGVVGNHDEFGNSMKSFEKSSLALLSKMGLINLLSKENPMIFTDNDGTTISITGADYDLEMESDTSHDAYILDKKAADFDIHIVHGMLTDKDLGKLIKHTKVSEIKDTKADLTISGHDHIGFEPVEIEGKLFVNPGAIIRSSNDAAEMKRIPKVMLIEITKSAGITLTMLPLKSALPSEIVLSTEKKHHVNNNDVEKMSDIVNDVKENKKESITDMVIAAAEKDAKLANVKDDILSRLSNKMAAEPSAKTVSVQDDYYIKNLTLDNFEGYEHASFDFSPKLNTIIGETNHGKSSVIRAFQFVFGELDMSAKNVIRHGQKEAKVSLTTSKGYIIERIVQSKSNGFNGYNVYYPNDNKWHKSNTKELPVILSILGYNHLFLDNKNHMSVNFLEQSNDWFFIGKSFTSSMRAKIIGAIYKTNFADAVIRDYESEMKKDKIELSLREQNSRDLKNKIATLKNTEALGERLKEIEALWQQIDKTEALLSSVNDLIQKFSEVSHSIDNIDRYMQNTESTSLMLDTLKQLHTLYYSKERCNSIIERSIKMDATLSGIDFYLVTTKDSVKFLNTIDMALEKHSVIKTTMINLKELASISKRISLIANYLEKTSKDVDYRNHLNRVQQINEKSIEINHYMSQMMIVIRRNRNLNSYISMCNKAISSKQIISDFEEKLQTQNKVTDIFNISNNIVNKGQELNAHISRLKQQYSIAEKDLETYLEKIEVCPLCLQKLSKEAINKMKG